MDLTIGMWGALLGVFVYVLGGAVFDALREWRWHREFGRPIRQHERTMEAVRHYPGCDLDGCDYERRQ